jgi:hypothetical protein
MIAEWAGKKDKKKKRNEGRKEQELKFKKH